MADIMADAVAAVSRPPAPSPADREAVLGAVRAHSPRVPQAVADAAGALVVTPAEVRAAATHSKPSTAPGPDGIPVDVWRKLGEPAFELLAAVFTAVGAAGRTPPGFLDGVVASIYKAKNAADAANYRPLTMLGSDYRILAKVLATRWTPLLSAVVGPEQTAFLAGRRISDNICLTQMLPGLLAANAAEGVGPTGAALALLDFRKAYDTIDRGFLIAVMEAVGVGDGVLAWTRTILTHTYASAEVNGFISAPRKYAAGVRQGCPAAPALFLFLGHALACFLRTCPAALGPVARITGRVQTAELWGAEAPLWANPLLQLELPAAQRSVQWREPTGDAAGHALFSPTDAARWLVDGLARVRDALPGMRTVTDLCVLWAWLAAVDMVFAGLRGLEAAVPTLWRMPLLNARKEPIWRLWPQPRASTSTSAPLGGTSCSGRAQPLKRRGLSKHFCKARSFMAIDLEALVRGAYGEHVASLGKRHSSASPPPPPTRPDSLMDSGECDHDRRSCWSSSGAAAPRPTSAAYAEGGQQHGYSPHHSCFPTSGYPTSGYPTGGSLRSAHASDATLYTDSRDSSARGHLMRTPSPPKGGAMSEVVSNELISALHAALRISS
ncbi:hypothetical protein FOA52_006163 [Chlamydomonas sp. UWO 241]|nr:hypothetical protein FOA52_006163 [Chlamydomonas sp. UWO 241]